MAYLCANFSLPRRLCSRLMPVVRDRQTSDAHHRLMLPTLGAGHNKPVGMGVVYLTLGEGLSPLRQGVGKITVRY